MYTALPGENTPGSLADIIKDGYARFIRSMAALTATLMGRKDEQFVTHTRAQDFTALPKSNGARLQNPPAVFSQPPGPHCVHGAQLKA